MSDSRYVMQNSQNLQALIENTTGVKVLSIEYKQLGGMVLLGKGHSQADVDKIENGRFDLRYKGKISVLMDRQKQKLIMLVDPERPQTTDQLALEAAVKHAVQRMTIDIKYWPVTFEWS